MKKFLTLMLLATLIWVPNGWALMEPGKGDEPTFWLPADVPASVIDPTTGFPTGVGGEDSGDVLAETINWLLDAITGLIDQLNNLELPEDGEDGKDGKDGRDGKDGSPGLQGPPGRTIVIGGHSDTNTLDEVLAKGNTTSRSIDAIEDITGSGTFTANKLEARSEVLSKGRLEVNDTSDLHGATMINNTLTVDLATTLKNTLDVFSSTTLQNTLDVTGETTLQSSLFGQSWAQFMGDVLVGGYLTVCDHAGFQRNVAIDGDFYHGGSSFNVSAGNVTFGGAVIQNVGDPVAGTDAVNKKYVDNLTSTPTMTPEEIRRYCDSLIYCQCQHCQDEKNKAGGGDGGPVGGGDQPPEPPPTEPVTMRSAWDAWLADQYAGLVGFNKPAQNGFNANGVSIGASTSYKIGSASVGANGWVGLYSAMFGSGATVLDYSVGLGNSVYSGYGSTVAGFGAGALSNGVAIGRSAWAENDGIAIGPGAVARKNRIQIGAGTNSTATLQINNKVYVDNDGFIPSALIKGPVQASTTNNLMIGKHNVEAPMAEQWDDDGNLIHIDRGLNAIAVGSGNTIGTYCVNGFVGGERCYVDSYNTFAFGYQCRADQDQSVAIGMDVFAGSLGGIGIGHSITIDMAADDGLGLGYHSQVDHYQSFVWNGAATCWDDATGESVPDEPYISHGMGTFNINPYGGLSGVWIGEQNLKQAIDTAVTNSSLGSRFFLRAGKPSVTSLAVSATATNVCILPTDTKIPTATAGTDCITLTGADVANYLTAKQAGLYKVTVTYAFTQAMAASQVITLELVTGTGATPATRLANQEGTVISDSRTVVTATWYAELAANATFRVRQSGTVAETLQITSARFTVEKL